MNRHDQALEVLLIIRRRLLDRMASVVVKHQSALLNGKAPSNNPLAASADLVEIIKNLDKLDNSIARLTDVAEDDLQSGPLPPVNLGKEEVRRDDIFGPYCQLVARNRLEQASRELSQILHMALDRVITATRFFARAVKADPSLTQELSRLGDPTENWSDARCVRTLIKTFGFQAVESRMATQALRSRVEHAGGSPIKA